jgi:hypothetical protein
MAHSAAARVIQTAPESVWNVTNELSTPRSI